MSKKLEVIVEFYGLQTKIESPAGHDEVPYRLLNLRFSHFGQFYPIVPRIGDYVTVP